MFAPIAPTPLDPYSEEYHQKLIYALQPDSDQCHHVPPHILPGFKDLLRKYPIAFLLPSAQQGQIKAFEHTIDTGEASPLYHPPYRKSPVELPNIRNGIQRMLDLKKLKPSHSEWGRGAPCILVKKPLKHGLSQSPRFCVDYHSLNWVTKGDNYSTPSVANILDAITYGKYMGNLIWPQAIGKSIFSNKIDTKLRSPCISGCLSSLGYPLDSKQPKHLSADIEYSFYSIPIQVANYLCGRLCNLVKLISGCT